MIHELVIYNPYNQVVNLMIDNNPIIMLLDYNELYSYHVIEKLQAVAHRAFLGFEYKINDFINNL